MEPLLTTIEAAKYLGYSPYTLRASRVSGKLSGRNPPKFIRLGSKTIRYKQSDLHDWILEVSK